MMMTGEQYRQSLNDGRKVYLEGDLVADLAAHPVFKVPVDLQASLYDRHYDPSPDALRDTIRTIASKEELREHAEEADERDILLAVTSASMMTLLTAADRIEAALPDNAARIRAWVDDAQARDIRIVQCITDAKGDRSKRPASRTTPTPTCRSSTAGPTGWSSAAPSCTSPPPRSGTS